jgi:hypothetical protein
MPGWQVSAKRLGHIRGNFDALRHNSIQLSAKRKRKGPPTSSSPFNRLTARRAISAPGSARSLRIASRASRSERTPESALELVEEVDGTCGEHAEERDTHCHCEIHDAS